MFKGNVSRRHFFRQAGCAAMGTTTLFSSLINLKMASALVSPPPECPNDYKALVCILLEGGNDSFNMLVPYSGTPYNTYAATRSELAIAQNELLPLGDPMTETVNFGIHPSMTEVKNLYDAGNLSFISNVGTLVEYLTDANDFFSGLKNVPLGLYSHSDQIQQWQTSVPQSRDAVGWGGRMADILHSCNDAQNISMNISLSGRNVFQAGKTVVEYAISNMGNGGSGIPDIMYYGNSGFLNNLRRTAVENMMAANYSNVFQSTFGDLTNQSLESQEQFSAALGNVQNFTTAFQPSFFATYPNDYMAYDLHQVARTIAARDALGMKRQTFFVSIGGWDHHDELIFSQAALLGEVSRALGEFYKALEEMGLQNDVITFSVSDFGRTLTSNGNGTDHSWGGNQFVMGGAVNGKNVFGTYPDLTLSNPLNIDDRGTMIPTLSTDEYFAELAAWFGLTNSELVDVLPNLNNFNYFSSPIGFIS